ncbi:MAG TPA: OmpA family protein [Polyangiaceae bacterium]|jgi:outer membrane protein OmpA-like peptidoglycan-associated protein|nr:OmpA family protein [Polyangiaceae bacterium]
MKSIKSIGFFIALTNVMGAMACAPDRPPQDLVSARFAYSRASHGPAASLNPSDMDTARKQLDVAEASFTKDGDTRNTRDQAYLALRKTELAEVVARTRQTDQSKDATVDAMHANEKKTVASTSAELARTRTQLLATGAAYNAQGAALQDEKTRREDAEKRALQAAADLAKFASVKQETRGMVITLSGSVLFASAKSDLLPAAQLKLNEVATALIKEDPLSNIVVEGHTDSQGSAPFNQDLSQRRAQAVRDYLVSRGMASDRITAQGFGLTRPVAENTSAEGRANNRRVEIVVQPSTTVAGQ